MGNDLLNKIIDLTDLPSDDVSQELENILVSQGIDPAEVTLGQLRQALSNYVQELFSEND